MKNVESIEADGSSAESSSGRTFVGILLYQEGMANGKIPVM